jgi:WD40-like Beta Propeller Repeat
VVAAVASALALACTPQPGAGNVAYVSAGALKVVDLGTCATRTVVARGVAMPLAFSHDGRWIAFGRGKVVSASGGKVLMPIGAVWRWAWAPRSDLLAGITPAGGVVEGGPGGPSGVLAPGGWGATSLVWKPDNRALAVGRGKFDGPATPNGIQEIVGFTAADQHVLYRTPHGQVAPPIVAAWIGQRIYFQPDFGSSASIAADGLPLRTLLPFRAPKPVLRAVLPQAGFVVGCGTSAIVVAGGDRNTETNKRVVAYDGAHVTTLAAGRGLAWLEPACGPSIAVAAGPDRPATGLIQPQRSIWLVSPLRRLTRSPKGWSDENPTWTANEKSLVFFRERFVKGSLFLVHPETGKLVGPLATNVAGFAVGR